MYQALYRKYRPSSFNDVVGQEVIVKTLKNAIKNNKISHAYIFSGPRGTGKTSIAKIFAKTINCLNINNLEPCNKCVSCTQIINKQDTDIIEIDAASNNGVDEIREIRNKVNLVPSVGKYKVYIIDEVHMLTTGAFNALLKTLEEPPEHAIFILATTDPHKIPATIVSRCQSFSFKRIPNDKIIDRLAGICKNEEIECENEALSEIARLAEGGLRDSISILDQVVAYSDSKITLNDIHDINGTVTQQDLKQLIDKIISREIKDVLKLISYYDESGKDFIKLTEEIILFFKNILLGKVSLDYFKELKLDEKIYLKDYEKLSSSEIITYIEKLNASILEMKKDSNPKLKLELLLIDLVLNTNYKMKNEIIKEKIEVSKNIIIQDESKNNESKKIEIDNDKKEKLKIVKQIRINNALSLFNKKNMILVKSEIDDLKPYLLDPDYSKIISLILDGTLKAVGNKYLVFVYDSENLSDLFNENILKIEETINNLLNKQYCVISTHINDWNKIKVEFNSKSKKYELMDENYDLNLILKSEAKKNKNTIEKMFDEIIEYN